MASCAAVDMTTNTRLVWGLVALTATIAIAVLGQRLAPPVMGPTGAESTSGCKVEAPDELKAAAKQWCANGLFQRVSVTGDKENVIAVAQFSANAAQLWQIQSGSLLPNFRVLTDRMADDAAGRNVAMSIHDAADHRIAACARVNTDKAAVCGEK